MQVEEGIVLLPELCILEISLRVYSIRNRLLLAKTTLLHVLQQQLCLALTCLYHRDYLIKAFEDHRANLQPLDPLKQVFS